MSDSIDRRIFIKSLALSTVAGLAASGGAPALAATPGLKLGPAKAFTFDTIKTQAKAMAREAYRGPRHAFAGSFAENRL